MLKKVAFTMYPVKDLQRAIQFYKDTFQIEPSSIMGEGKWVEYDLPEGGCFALTSMVPDLAPGASVAFEVDDLPAVMESIKAKNIEIKMDIFQSPVCQLAVIFDSEGNAITLHQLNRAT